MGSTTAAALLSQLAFWLLLALGVTRDALRKRTAIVFIVLWLAGYAGLPRIAWWTGPFVTTWTAVLDIVLVFIVFEGDVRLT